MIGSLNLQVSMSKNVKCLVFSIISLWAQWFSRTLSKVRGGGGDLSFRLWDWASFFSPSPPSHVQWPWANPKKYNRLVTPVSIQVWDLRHARSSLCPGRSYTCHMERATCSCMRTVVQQSTKIVGWSTSTQNKPHRIGTLLSNKKWYKLLLHFLPCCGLLH